MSLGRNDPCRCGSGRKYKKCCLPSDQKEKAAIRQIDSHASYVNHYCQVIVTKTESAVENDRARLSQKWAALGSNPRFDASLTEHCLLDAAERSSMIQTLLADSELSEAQQVELTEALTDSRAVFAQVSACRRHEYIELTDVLTGTTTRINDAGLSLVLEPREAICCRIVMVKDEAALLPSWFKISFWSQKALKAALQTKLKENDVDTSDALETSIALKRMPELLYGEIVHLNAVSEGA